jgi:multimeric flavodoxin WrbA
MKVTLLNGSPKGAKSASKLIIEALQTKFGPDTTSEVVHIARLAPQDIIDVATSSDAIVFVFPLYVDSIPSHVLRFMDESGLALTAAAPGATVYAVVNNGFYEGAQTSIALEIMRNFCTHVGLPWGRGVGVGAGGLVGPIPIATAPMKKLDAGLAKLATNIEHRQTGPDVFIKPLIPRAFYITSAHITWRKEAKKNGLSEQQLLATPAIEL